MTTRLASCIDEQILAIWRALRVNPSLDARWAMQVIDRLLDERRSLGQLPPPVTPPDPAFPASSQAVPPSSPQAVPPSGLQAILASVIRALLAGEPG